MNAVPLTARVRCKNKACGQKVPLSREQVCELSGRLRVEVTCAACGQRFAPSMLRRVKEKANDPRVAVEAPPPVPIPVPTGAKQAAPPFRPLPQVQGDAAPPPTPTEWLPAAPLPGADALPFSPIQTAPPTSDKPTGGGRGWWGRQSKRTQYLILGVGVAVMAGAAFTVQTLGKAKPALPPATASRETPPTTPPTAPRSKPRVAVPPSEPVDPAATIDELKPEELRIADPTEPVVTIPGK